MITEKPCFIATGLPSYKEAARQARAAGYTRFKIENKPCKTCGSIVFRVSGPGTRCAVCSLRSNDACRERFGNEHVNAQSVRWNKDNPDIRNAHSAERRAIRQQRTMPWTDLEAIKELYLKAQQLTDLTGIKHVVDHKIPLRGDIVSGLHVYDNLHVIPDKQNASKGNKFDCKLWCFCEPRCPDGGDGSIFLEVLNSGK